MSAFCDMVSDAALVLEEAFGDAASYVDDTLDEAIAVVVVVDDRVVEEEERDSGTYQVERVMCRVQSRVGVNVIVGGTITIGNLEHVVERVTTGIGWILVTARRLVSVERAGSRVRRSR